MSNEVMAAGDECRITELENDELIELFSLGLTYCPPASERATILFSYPEISR
jgi:hypothetical protein